MSSKWGDAWVPTTTTTALDRIRDTLSNARSPVKGAVQPADKNDASFYADPTVPLSLFLVDGVLPASRTEEGNGDGGDDDGPLRKCPLDATVSPTKPASGPSSTSSSSSSLRPAWEVPPVDKKSGRIVDQPLTFHARIKSSGYGQQPAQKMQQRKPGKIALPATLRSSSAPKAAGRQRDIMPSSSSEGARLRSYPMDCGPTTQHQPHNDHPAAAPVFGLAFCNDASQLVLHTADATPTTVRLPVHRFPGDGGRRFLGHDGRVTSAVFSHSGQRLLTASEDGTAMVWSAAKGAVTAAAADGPLVVISHHRHQPSNPPAAANANGSGSGSGGGRGYSTSIVGAFQPLSDKDKNPRNRPFGAPVCGATFFYMDKFILLAVKASVMLYTYASDKEEHAPAAPRAAPLRSGSLTTLDALRRNHSRGRYLRAALWGLEPAQQVTALAAVNSVKSPLAFCATSDRRLHVLDAAVGCVARSMDCGHDRAVHAIALPSPSVYASLPMDGYDVFATAATDNAVALWDLRTPAVVMRYTYVEGHPWLYFATFAASSYITSPHLTSHHHLTSPHLTSSPHLIPLLSIIRAQWAREPSLRAGDLRAQPVPALPGGRFRGPRSPRRRRAHRHRAGAPHRRPRHRHRRRLQSTLPTARGRLPRRQSPLLHRPIHRYRRPVMRGQDMIGYLDIYVCMCRSGAPCTWKNIYCGISLRVRVRVRVRVCACACACVFTCPPSSALAAPRRRSARWSGTWRARTKSSPW